jgi:hypothetical protein
MATIIKTTIATLRRWGTPFLLSHRLIGRNINAMNIEKVSGTNIKDNILRK